MAAPTAPATTTCRRGACCTETRPVDLSQIAPDLAGFWGQWLRPSAGLPTVLWSLLLAVAAASGHLVRRYMSQFGSSRQSQAP